NGVSGDELDAGRGSPGAEGRYVLSLAHYAPWKGIDVLIRAFALVAAAHPELRLVVAGDGAGRAEMRALADALGVGGRVELRDEEKRPMVARLLHGCALFVLPSRAESFGVALVEAMACARPVIGTRVGGIPEVVTDGVDGWTVPPDDPAELAAAMRRALDDPARAEAVGRAAHATVERRFLREHAGAAYAALFDALAADVARPSPTSKPSMETGDEGRLERGMDTQGSPAFAAEVTRPSSASKPSIETEDEGRRGRGVETRPSPALANPSPTSKPSIETDDERRRGRGVDTYPSSALAAEVTHPSSALKPSMEMGDEGRRVRGMEESPSPSIVSPDFFPDESAIAEAGR
ncbi:MAG TPA: glycosyltransferase family 4 protein, partial [Longimicrobium sp.]|nr:glycosyltransferase family 4 protein [Longimicrobium sp.]